MKCGTCRFYDEPNGECHFNAPKPGRSAEESNWPGVHPDHWCGRYKEGAREVPDDLKTKYDDAIRLGTELWMAANAVRDSDINIISNAGFDALRKVLKKTESTFDEIPF